MTAITRDLLKSLEDQLSGIGSGTTFSDDELKSFPVTWRQVYDYKLCGQDLLATPANAIGKGEDGGFEIPFSFIDGREALAIYDSEYRPDIPDEFVQIGNLYGVSEVVLLNTAKQSIHVFHTSDMVDLDWLKYKLEKQLCSADEFLRQIRVQTVCCLINPNKYSEYDLIEIVKETTVKVNEDQTEYPDEPTARTAYLQAIADSLSAGKEIHYAPRQLATELAARKSS